MKGVIILLFITLASTLSAQTTMEEYNYLTKGLKIQIDSGLDMKKGYAIDTIYDNELTLCALLRLKPSGKEVAAYLIMLYPADYYGGASDVEFICIPRAETPEMQERFVSDLRKINDVEKLQLIVAMQTVVMDWTSNWK